MSVEIKSDEPANNFPPDPSNNDPEISRSHVNDGFPAHIQRYLSEELIIKALPRESFDVVVFCLLLTYLPSRQQRWQCCLKAHKLLKENGLLLIITPDSSHQNKNMVMIKSWKAAIESIGFFRWKYHKASHTHCMAFRKTKVCKAACVGMGPEMLYIHQDFEVIHDESNEEHASYNEKSLAEGFNALPFG